jgi:glucans biosynthesis protein
MRRRLQARVLERRRALLGALAVAMASFGLPAPALTLDDVAARAAELAASSYRKPDVDLPDEIRKLSYDAYRDVRFTPARALWRGAGLPFEVMFFHQGWHFTDPVKINEVTASGVREIPFDPGAFDYGKNEVDRSRLGKLAFAGFRVHFPLNTPRYKDETLVFLGASYFRALGRGQLYGVSARGLAVDTALSTGEEFPRFVEFWIERPAATASELTIFALLDSPRAAGAYRFVLKPGVTTVLDVEVRLFLRAAVGKLGAAPLTSMFFFGGNQRSAKEDYRPQVHDSDGLMIQSSTGEWLWRPLVSPRRLLVTSFALTDPLGFGLMQRERRFARYEDLEARYDLRPSAWVETKGAWGAGRLELVQIPLPDETNDNIVAYWVPDHVPGPREPIAYAYRVLWQKEREARPPFAWVSQTRSGRGYAPSPDDTIQFQLDFVGPQLERLPRHAGVEAALSIGSNGAIVEQNTMHNEVTRGWRVQVRFRRIDKGKPVELRAHLRAGTEVLSETWSYVHPPD